MKRQSYPPFCAGKKSKYDVTNTPMINVLVTAGSPAMVNQFVLMGREMVSRGITIHIVATRKNSWDFLKKTGWEHGHFLESKKTGDDSENNLRKYMEKYNNPTIAEMIKSEEALIGWSETEKLNLLTSFLDFYEEYYDAKNVNIVMKYPTASMAGRAAYAVAKRKNISTFIINTGPLIRESFTFNDIDEGWLWSEFFKQYENGNVIVNENNRKFVDESVSEIIKSKKLSLKVKQTSPLKFGYLFLKFLGTIFKSHIDYIEVNELKKEFMMFLDYFYFWTRYHNIEKGKPYIFFPLHIPWDAQIATRNPMFYSQAALVEMLARSCPPGVDLYVKEHPYYHGLCNRKMRRELKKIRSVKFLDPSISSLDAIKHSSLVVTINSTAGFETIINKKPLVVLGNPFYAYYKHAYKIENLNELPRVVNEALCLGNEIYSDSDEWYKFMYSALNSSKKGPMLLYKKYMGFEEELNKKVMAELSDELEKKIRSSLTAKRIN
ncbi:MAG: hypothetical protein ACE5EN_04105 [Nitrospinota bacterium]